MTSSGPRQVVSLHNTNVFEAGYFYAEGQRSGDTQQGGSIAHSLSRLPPASSRAGARARRACTQACLKESGSAFSQKTELPNFKVSLNFKPCFHLHSSAAG